MPKSKRRSSPKSTKSKRRSSPKSTKAKVKAGSREKGKHEKANKKELDKIPSSKILRGAAAIGTFGLNEAIIQAHKATSTHRAKAKDVKEGNIKAPTMKAERRTTVQEDYAAYKRKNR